VVAATIAACFVLSWAVVGMVDVGGDREAIYLTWHDWQWVNGRLVFLEITVGKIALHWRQTEDEGVVAERAVGPGGVRSGRGCVGVGTLRLLWSY